VAVPGDNQALARLGALVGEWTLEAGPPDSPPWPGEGRVAFEWLEGERFLIQRWSIDMPEAPDGIAIIGPGDEPDAFRQHYFDSRGVERVYEMTLAGGGWRMWRDATDPFPNVSPRPSRTTTRSRTAGRRTRAAGASTSTSPTGGGGDEANDSLAFGAPQPGA